MKRLLAALIFVSVFLHCLAPFSFAQTQATESALPSRVESDVPNDYSTHTQMLIIELLAAISCQLSGVDPVNPSGKCLGVNPETGKIGFMENGGGGAIAVVTKMMIFTFDIPISTHDYTSYTASNFGIVKSSFAQNVSAGFNGLSPLLPVWVAFRNVIYVLFVIAFMVVGMGIMFRRNIDPKTVMTVQNSIPRVIIILVLVTFSFAIAGFLIDMMYLSMYLLYGIVSSVEGVNIPGLSPTNLVGSTPFGATGSFGSGIPGIAYDASRGLGSQISAIFDNGIGNTIGGVIAGVMLLPLIIISGPIGWISGGLGLLGGIGGLGNEVLGLVGGIIAFLIIVIAIISALFRLWIALIKSYLFILIDVAIAPIWIAGSLIPGSPWTIGSWFRHILKYILVFPLTFAMFLLGTAITQLFSAIPDDASIFAPPFIGNSLNPKHLGSLLGLGLILMLPEVINMVQSIIKAPENQFQKAIGQGFKVGTSVASAPIKKGRDILFEKDGEGNPKGPGAIAQKYIMRDVKHKLGNVIPQSVKDRVANGRLAKWQKQEDAEYNMYHNTPRRGSLERQREDSEKQQQEGQREGQRVQNFLSQLNSSLLNTDAGGNINITINPEFTDSEMNSIDNSQIESIVNRLKSSPIYENQSDTFIKNAARKEFLHGQVQQIQQIQSKLNTGAPLTEDDRSLFTGLAQSIANDPNFNRIFQHLKNDPNNVGRSEDELRSIALQNYQQLFPVLARKYALRDSLRTNS